MKSNAVGKNTSKAEVAHISPFGLWIIISGREYFLPFTEYPWFKEATITQIMNLKLIHDHHLYWSELDVDLDVRSLENLENYPLIYK